MKKTYKLLIGILIIFVFVVLFFVLRYLNRTLYNDELIYGTSAGNFYNGGLFCEANGYVYFSNPYDASRLYRMNPDGTNVKKLTEESCCFINADSHYLYYARSGETPNHEFSFLYLNTNSLCRIPVNGGKTLILDEAPALYAILIQNNLYYIHYDKKTLSTLYKVGIDGKEQHLVSQEPLLLSPGLEGSLCYAGVTNDHNIGLWNPDTDTGSMIYGGICYLPIDTNSYVYFMNCADNYTLACYEKSTGTVKKITDCRVDCYNLTDEYIYYQKNDGDNSALCRLRLDNTAPEEVVMKGNFTNIHTTSNYVYFGFFVSPELVYQTPANGDINVTAFSLQY